VSIACSSVFLREEKQRKSPKKSTYFFSSQCPLHLWEEKRLKKKGRKRGEKGSLLEGVRTFWLSPSLLFLCRSLSPLSCFVLLSFHKTKRTRETDRRKKQIEEEPEKFSLPPHPPFPFLGKQNNRNNAG
jgi:hypothetical protein